MIFFFKCNPTVLKLGFKLFGFACQNTKMLCSLTVILGRVGSCDLPMEEFKGHWLFFPPKRIKCRTCAKGGKGKDKKAVKPVLCFVF